MTNEELTAIHTSRRTFGKLFNEFYKTGAGVELGVQLGFNSKTILQGYKGKLICVDRWDKPEELKHCITILQPFVLRYHLFVSDTVEAAKEIKDKSLDFVYIDAGHSFEEVKADYEAWLPKVRPGGIISGHDYGENDCIGVKQYIDLLISQGEKFNFTTEDFWEGREYQSFWKIVE